MRQHRKALTALDDGNGSEDNRERNSAGHEQIAGKRKLLLAHPRGKDAYELERFRYESTKSSVVSRSLC